MASQKFETITVERIDSVEVVTLNRPKQLNTLNQKMITELVMYFSDLETRDLVENGPELNPRVIVLKGNGRAFSAGLDLFGTEMPSESVQIFNLQRRLSQIMMLMRRIKQPIVSLLHGAVCGAGLALALASDVRLAAEDAKFNVAMAKIGLTGGDLGISYFLPRALGTSIAAEMMMTGDFLLAPRAYQLGFISHMYANVDELQAAGLKFAERMVEITPPSALFMTKEAIRFNLNAPDLESAIALEDRQQLLQLQSADFPTYAAKAFPKAGKANL